MRVSDHTRRAWGEHQPISRHPLFPAIVALWCGALFGVAGILVSAGLVESIVTALGIDRVIPMAAPPLGGTMRILLALALTGFGAGVGLLVARRLAAAAPAAPHERRRRAVPVAEERRRSRITLARTGGAGRRSTAAQTVLAAEDGTEQAPVPGREAQILSVAEFDLGGFEDDAESAAADEMETAPRGGSFAPRLPAGAQVFHASQPEEDADEATNGSLFETYSREITARAVQAGPHAASDHAAPDRVAAAPVPGFMLLSGLHAPDRHRDAEIAQDADEELEESLVEDAAFAPASAAAEASDAPLPADTAEAPGEDWENAGPTAAERIASASLGELSPVELLERLALAMAQRREQARLAAVAAVAPQPEPEPAPAEEPVAAATPVTEVPQFDVGAPLAFAPLAFEMPRFDAASAAEAVEGDDAAEAAPAPAPVPAALRPVNLHAFADEDDALPGYIPPRHIGLTPATPAVQGDDEDADDEESRVLEQGYSSLLDLSRPLAPRGGEAEDAVPIQRLAPAEDAAEPRPVAVFPEPARASAPFARPAASAVGEGVAARERRFDAPGRPDPEETERALRAALATLQRMSGAA